LKNNDKGNDPDRLDIFHEPGNTGHLQGLGNKADQQNEKQTDKHPRGKGPAQEFVHLEEKETHHTDIEDIDKTDGYVTEIKKMQKRSLFL
jgi:hypothetical protein